MTESELSAWHVLLAAENYIRKLDTGRPWSEQKDSLELLRKRVHEYSGYPKVPYKVPGQ